MNERGALDELKLFLRNEKTVKLWNNIIIDGTPLTLYKQDIVADIAFMGDFELGAGDNRPVAGVRG